MTQERGAAGRRDGRDGAQRRSRADRLLGGAADPAARTRRTERGEVPAAVRRAALVVALEAALLLGGALVLLYLTLTSTTLGSGNAVALAVLVGATGAAMAAAAVGLWRMSAWARGPVVALNLIVAAIGLSALTADRPEIGVPVLVVVAVVLYLLATPEARLAFYERSEG